MDYGIIKGMRERWKNRKEFILHLRKRRMDLGKSQEEVSKALGKSASYIYQVERGRAIPSAEVLIELSRIYREDPQDYLAVRSKIGNGDESLRFWKSLLSREAKGVYIADSRRVPVVNLEQCSNAENFTDKGHLMDIADDYRLAHTKDDHAFYVRAEGDSMCPHIEPGDLVLIEPNVAVNNGDIVFARTAKGAVVKRLYSASDNSIFLLSLNSNYPPIEIKDRRGFRCFKATRISREL
jgi:phage repressor protein C with HTH and peptisase S24 domain